MSRSGWRAPELGGHSRPFHLLAVIFILLSARRYDFIEIRDGDSESADLLGKHCGNIAPPTIVSSGSVLYIKFTSDYARQGAGFSLRYEIFRTGQRGRGWGDPPAPPGSGHGALSIGSA